MSPSSPWHGRNSAKDLIRQHIWQQLLEHDAVIRPPFGQIPAFRLASQASSVLETLAVWQQAQVVKCNPDTAQAPVRQATLQAGKTLLMAVPQLKTDVCFVELTQERVTQVGLSLEKAAIAQNILRYGTPVPFEAMPLIDLVVVGCVGVDRAGGRTGKGAGFADLELALLDSFDRITRQTPIITTVDARQIMDSPLPMEPHDWPLDWVITPQEAIATHTQYPKPNGIDWLSIQPDQWASIPVLRPIRKAQVQDTLSIRPVEMKDAPQLLAGVNQVIAEQIYLGSAEPFSAENQRPYLESVITRHYPMLVAEYQGQIVGNCDIIPYLELGFRHVGRLGMWILPEFRGLGIGRSLLQQSLDWAKRFGLEKVELQVYADNERAIELYKCAGFIVEGHRKKARKMAERYQDLIHMGLFLNLLP